MNFCGDDNDDASAPVSSVLAFVVVVVDDSPSSFDDARGACAFAWFGCWEEVVAYFIGRDARGGVAAVGVLSSVALIVVVVVSVGRCSTAF